ncbi:MAG: cbb3-type cytochrome c oxidase subunit I, partial [Bacteroidales bacterium]|nr:cbb3-type cytochrome c oxidase subunit I [Bacteroidales bacterium]
MSITAANPDLSFYQVAKGIRSWLFTLDHKRIALLYFYTISSFFLVGMALGFLMRLELIAPGKDLMEAHTYNQIFTLHGVIMIFLFIIPVIPAIFGNFFLPIMIGTDDVAFPKLNLTSWYLYIFGGALALLTLVVGDGPADTGWTF